jgi:hypothetical protein
VRTTDLADLLAELRAQRARCDALLAADDARQVAPRRRAPMNEAERRKYWEREFRAMQRRRAQRDDELL